MVSSAWPWLWSVTSPSSQDPFHFGHQGLNLGPSVCHQDSGLPLVLRQLVGHPDQMVPWPYTHTLRRSASLGGDAFLFAAPPPPQPSPANRCLCCFGFHSQRTQGCHLASLRWGWLFWLPPPPDNNTTPSISMASLSFLVPFATVWARQQAGLGEGGSGLLRCAAGLCHGLLLPDLLRGWGEK